MIEVYVCLLIRFYNVGGTFVYCSSFGIYSILYLSRKQETCSLLRNFIIIVFSKFLYYKVVRSTCKAIRIFKPKGFDIVQHSVKMK